MITAAQRVAPLVKTNTMLGPSTPTRARRGSVGVSPVRRGSVLDHQTHHEFQDDLLGRPEDVGRSPHSSLMRKTKSLLHRRAPSMKKDVPKYIKEGEIKKLTSHQKWVEKHMGLTEEILTISDADNRTDYIPLHEITEVSASQLKEGVSSLRRNSAAELVEAADSTNAISFLRSKLMATSNESNKQIQPHAAFDIFTTVDGRNSGRKYTFMAETAEESEEWVSVLQVESRKRIKFMKKQTKLEEWREWARNTYNSWYIQGFVSFLIFFNFGVNAIQAEIHPHTIKASSGEGEARMYVLLDIVLTVVFIVEIMFNAFGHWFWPFITDKWNWFDAFIVAISMISILVPAVPGLTILRVLRAFRLLRLIRKLRSLKRIFDALILSIVPVLNAFFIGVLITFIYTIVGVFLFADAAYEHFGTFTRSLYTLFMLIATGDWPSEAIEPFKEDGNIDIVAFAYLFSFVATVLWTCIQVVVAVLLDNFLSVTQAEKREEAIAAELAKSKHQQLDPLLQRLCESFETDDDLCADIRAVFDILDVDNSGSVNNEEMVEGFGKLQVTPRIRLSPDDCKVMKEHCIGLTDDDQELDGATFERLMKVQLYHFVQRKVHDAYMYNEDPAVSALLAAFKIVLVGGSGSEGLENLRGGEGGGERVSAVEKQVEGVRAELAGAREQLAGLQRIVEEGFAKLGGQAQAPQRKKGDGGKAGRGEKQWFGGEQEGKGSLGALDSLANNFGNTFSQLGESFSALGRPDPAPFPPWGVGSPGRLRRNSPTEEGGRRGEGREEVRKGRGQGQGGASAASPPARPPREGGERQEEGKGKKDKEKDEAVGGSGGEGWADSDRTEETQRRVSLSGGGGGTERSENRPSRVAEEPMQLRDVQFEWVQLGVKDLRPSQRERGAIVVDPSSGRRRIQINADLVHPPHDTPAPPKPQPSLELAPQEERPSRRRLRPPMLNTAEPPRDAAAA